MRYHSVLFTLLIAFWASGAVVFAQGLFTWEQTSGPCGANLLTLAMDGTGGVYASTYYNGVYYAPPTDGEPVWQPLGKGLQARLDAESSGPVRSLAGARGVGHEMYAASWSKVYRLAPGSEIWNDVSSGLEFAGLSIMIVMNSKGTVFCAAGTRFFKLEKGGMTWSALQVPYETYGGMAITGAGSMAIGRDDALFVGIASGGVIRSTDNGATWSMVMQPGTSPTLNQPAKLASSPSGDIYSVHETLQRSTDNGATWSTIPAHYGIDAIAVGSNDEIYIGISRELSDQWGLYVTKDQGITWTRPEPALKNYGISAIAAGDYCYINSGEMVVRSTNQGATWKPAARGLNYATTDLIDISPNDVIAAGHGRLLSISADGGAHWMDRGMLRPTALRWDSGGRLLMGVENGLLRSADSGITWQQILDGNLIVRDIEVKGTLRMAVIVSEVISYLGLDHFDGSILISRDGGNTWEASEDGLPADSVVADLAVDTKGYYYAAVNPAGIFRSIDDCRTWQKLYDIYPGTTFNRIEIHPSGDIMAAGISSISRYSQEPTRSYNHVPKASGECWDIATSDLYCVIATSDGILVSPYGNNDFTFLGNGRCVCIDADRKGNFFAGRQSNSIWRTGSGTLSSPWDRIGGLPAAPSLTLSPNPAANRLQVRYTLAEEQQVAIELHDLSGRAVRDLPAAYQEAGDHTTDLDLGDLPGGTYFVGLRLGNITSATAPFVIRR